MCDSASIHERIGTYKNVFCTPEGASLRCVSGWIDIDAFGKCADVGAHVTRRLGLNSTTSNPTSISMQTHPSLNLEVQVENRE